MGDVSEFFFRTIAWIFTRLPRRDTLLPNFYQIGVLSLPVVALTGTFIGMVLAVQSHSQFRLLHLETRLGAVINMSLVRELGPVLAATMLAGRVGSAMAAELGTMRVTEQIDALSSMGANPIHYLVVPRFLACLVLIPTLTIMADFMGVVGGAFYSIYGLGIDSNHYWENSQDYVGTFDLFSGVFKSLFFGAAIALISCYRGFHCDPGAEGVGLRGNLGLRGLVRNDFVPRLLSGDRPGRPVLDDLARGNSIALSGFHKMAADCQLRGVVQENGVIPFFPQAKERDGFDRRQPEQSGAADPLVAMRGVHVDVRPQSGAARHRSDGPARADAGHHRRERLRQDRAAQDNDRIDQTARAAR